LLRIVYDLFVPLVNAAVYFDHEPRLAAVTVHDKLTYWMLASKV
jgi:hypothetical protein